MSILLEAAGWACLVLGSVFCMIGGLGMLRMPDLFTRAHAAGLTDTLGAALILVGLMTQIELGQVTVKLLMVLVFLWITSPTATHALMKAAFAAGIHAPEEPDEEAEVRGV